MPQRPPRPRSRVLAPFEDKLPVHDHVFDPFAVLKRLLVSRVVHDSLVIEDSDVRKRAGSQATAVTDAELGGIERGHFAYGIFQPEQTALARIDAQRPRECAEVARVGIATSQRPFGGEGGTV